MAITAGPSAALFRTIAEMLESFGMHTGGKDYQRLVGAFERILDAPIFFGTAFLRSGDHDPTEPFQLHA